MKLWDLVFTVAIVVIAVWYLYRKFVVNKGCSCGSSCSNAKSGKCTSPSTDDNRNSCNCQDGE
ncbi:MAG TPA: hypothetical protein EYH19_05525 [Desulfocapsa sulfexigens]|nr:hypothetical protein [Desulfocapsa sulfexigens]